MVRFLIAVSSVFLAASLVGAQEFRGGFEFRWLSTPNESHRRVQLLSEVVFESKDGTLWTVPAGTNVDGASIPRLLWTFAGSPYVGQ